jgi:hypothetical protein
MPVTSRDEPPRVFQPLPGRTVDRSVAYEAVLRDLLRLVGAEPPVLDESGPEGRRIWRGRARHLAGRTIANRAKQAEDAGPVPEEWFDPLIRAAVHEPDPSFVRFLVEPALAAFGRRRVRLALLAYLETGTAADAAGVARAWYWTLVPLTYVGGSRFPTTESVAEHERYEDLDRRYDEVALRRFVADEDLDVRRCLLPGLRLRPEAFPADMQDLVVRAIEIARTSDDEYLRHRVEIQTG